MAAFAYYNEIDTFAAEWLWALIKAGVIADGIVDTRPIQEVEASDLEGYTQHHFFAGIGGWSYALRLAGWPDDRPIWTGSCPCQPFSTAGKKGGFEDDRHLWPYFINLIIQSRPATLAGEQVASPDGLKWLDVVSAGLEDSGYTVGATDLCAAGVGAPHIRQRLYWVADDTSERRDRSVDPAGATGWSGAEDGRGLGDAGCERRQQDAGSAPRDESTNGRGKSRDHVVTSASEARQFPQNATTGIWTPADWIYCRDDKYRPVEPGTFPLAHGVPGRVGRLRGYGNAIVPEVAAVFIQAYCEARGLALYGHR